MAGLKQLIQEIHRRSLWQVLAIYAGGALIGYQAVQAMTEGLGLPQWLPAFAALLLLIGFSPRTGQSPIADATPL